MRLLMASLLLASLAGCSHSVYQYQDDRPILQLENFFSGHLEAHGLVKNRFGKVTRRFTATIDARWQDSVGRLDEHFVFNDGEQQTRCWQLNKTEQGYQGTANDVVGTANGVVSGNTLHWVYQLAIPINDKTWNITLDDWLYLIDDDHLINTTRMKKWGITVGELIIHIRRVNDSPLGDFENCPLKL